jgi:hypothetical protein
MCDIAISSYKQQWFKMANSNALTASWLWPPTATPLGTRSRAERIITGQLMAGRDVVEHPGTQVKAATSVFPFSTRPGSS